MAGDDERCGDAPLSGSLLGGGAVKPRAWERRRLSHRAVRGGAVDFPSFTRLWRSRMSIAAVLALLTVRDAVVKFGRRRCQLFQ